MSGGLDDAQSRLQQRRRKLGIAPAQAPRREPEATPEDVGEQEADDDGPLFKGQASGALVDLVEPGDYAMTFLKAETAFVFNRPVIFAHFQIVDGPALGKVLPRFYNKPASGRLARSSSLWGDFVAITGLRPPWKGFRLRDLARRVRGDGERRHCQRAPGEGRPFPDPPRASLLEGRASPRARERRPPCVAVADETLRIWN